MKRQFQKREVILLLHNIRSTHNVGSMFRTADAAGISKVILTGYTPHPIDQFKRPNSAIAKTALGAEKSIPWEAAKKPSPVLRRLKKKGFQVIAIEQHAGSVDYKNIRIRNKTCFIVGNEVEGVPPAILKQADAVAEIHMRGQKESLNVSVALGIALFRILDI